jgi:hypothetical protein
MFFNIVVCSQKPRGFSPEGVPENVAEKIN